MAKLDYFLFCEDVSIDENGKHTLVGIFDTVAVPDKPSTIGIFKLAFSAIPEKADVVQGFVKMKVVVADPKGSIRGVLEVEARPKDKTEFQPSPMATYLDIGNEFVVKEDGDYSFKFYIGNKLLAKRILHVVPKEGMLKHDNK